MQYRASSIGDYRELDDRMMRWTGEICWAIELKNGTFHIEGIIGSSAIELIEINPRPGGSEVVPIVESISGVDLALQTVRLWLGRSPSQYPQAKARRSVMYAI